MDPRTRAIAMSCNFQQSFPFPAVFSSHDVGGDNGDNPETNRNKSYEHTSENKDDCEYYLEMRRVCYLVSAGRLDIYLEYFLENSSIWRVSVLQKCRFFKDVIHEKFMMCSGIIISTHFQMFG